MVGFFNGLEKLVFFNKVWEMFDSGLKKLSGQNLVGWIVPVTR